LNLALRLLKRLVLDHDGPTAVEYAVMLALIVALCLPSLSYLGPNCARNFFIIVVTLKGH
jgi:pilus assembly protein Flp/PilA